MTELRIEPIFEGNDSISIVSTAGESDRVAEFLTSLNDRVRSRFHYFFLKLSMKMRLKSPQHMRQIKGVRDPYGKGAEVHELKVDVSPGYRVYLVRFNNRWFVTHGRKGKPKDRDVPKEAEKALSIFYSDMGQIQEGEDQ
ncbi:hypothetical protein [Leucobacter chromiiresistens]|uniref:hypothetical protein n=1 Tax=Leucobacter chromiiresistens TaxID=1079994 RepID=UPI00128F460A|nr:hypothetical protein [Leucobacter chromiiresistens]